MWQDVTEEITWEENEVKLEASLNDLCKFLITQCLFSRPSCTATRLGYFIGGDAHVASA